MKINSLRFHSALVACSVLMASFPAVASGYHCKLPMLIYVDIKNGSPKPETSIDPSIEFRLNVAPDGRTADSGGQTFNIINMNGMRTFISVAEGLVSGTDIITIYTNFSNGRFYSVESRQVVIVGKPTAELMIGTCSSVE